MVKHFLNASTKQGLYLKSMVKHLNQMLDDYGAKQLDEALAEALLRETLSLHAVRINLEKIREREQQLPPIHIELPDDDRIRNLAVRTHALTEYDLALVDDKEEKNDD